MPGESVSVKDRADPPRGRARELGHDALARRHPPADAQSGIPTQDSSAPWVPTSGRTR